MTVVALLVFVTAISLFVEQNGMLEMTVLVVPVAPRVAPLAGNSVTPGDCEEPFAPALTWVEIEPPVYAMNPPPPPPPGPSDSSGNMGAGGIWLPPAPPLACALMPLTPLALMTIVPPAPAPPAASRLSP